VEEVGGLGNPHVVISLGAQPSEQGRCGGRTAEPYLKHLNCWSNGRSRKAGLGGDFSRIINPERVKKTGGVSLQRVWDGSRRRLRGLKGPDGVPGGTS